MALQKKVNKLQVEHVSEEEVDQVRTVPTAPAGPEDGLAAACGPRDFFLRRAFLLAHSNARRGGVWRRGGSCRVLSRARGRRGGAL